MKLNVGLARKVGLPEYSSICASCNVEVELNGSMVFDDLEGFHRHVRQAYVACQQAVNDQLARHTNGGTGQAAKAPPAQQPSGNGHQGNGHRASGKQVDYINQLARQIRGLGVRRLESLADRMFGKPMADLTSLDASGLIDTLKSIKAGDINLDNVLNGAAA
jgi:hypothetical protein